MIINKHTQELNFYRFAVDTFMVFVGWLFAFFLRFHTGLVEVTKGEDTLTNALRLSPILLLSYILIFNVTGVYRRALVKRRIWEEHFDLARSHLLSFVVFVTSVYFIYESRFSRVTLLFFFALMPVLLPFGRSFVRKMSRGYLRRNRTRAKCVVVGSGHLARHVNDLVRGRAEWSLDVVATYTPDTLGDLREALKKGDFAAVFIALNTQEMSSLQQIYDALGNTVAEVYFIPDLGLPDFLNPEVIRVDTLPALALNTSSLDGYGRIAKRCFDILFSLCFLILASPVFIACAVAVKLTSRGPVFYKQERMGLDGKVFQCIKFRGMVVNAEDKTGPVWAKADDDRTTVVGRWLRKTSLDEIPQFINVLFGDMSVVGPRPERPFFVDDFRHTIPGYMLRHKVKAGVTGWAQIHGWRGNTSLEKRIECDLWYLQNWSLWLDLKICLLTPLRLVHPNAY